MLLAPSINQNKIQESVEGETMTDVERLMSCCLGSFLEHAHISHVCVNHVQLLTYLSVAEVHVLSVVGRFAADEKED